MKSHSLFISRKWLIILAAVLVVGFAIALVGFSPSQFGHSGVDELQFDTLLVNNSCSGQFCSAVCPANYRVVGGGCGVQSPRPNQFNLMGASGDQTAWNCFDSNNALGHSNIEVSAICLRVGNSAPSPYEFCGNYTIEPAAPPGNVNEVCDMNNVGPYGCSDFGYQLPTGEIVPFCNGFLACNGACSDYAVNDCQYCNTSNCPIGEIFCNDGTCQSDCTGHGGGSGNGVPVGGGAACGPPGSSSPGICPGAGGPGGGSGGGYCGDLLVEYPEQCDGDGHSQCDQTNTSVSCPAGTHLGPIHWDCTAACACEDNTQCVPDSCPGSIACQTQSQCEGICPGGGTSTCSAGCCGPCFGGAGGGGAPN